MDVYIYIYEYKSVYLYIYIQSADFMTHAATGCASGFMMNAVVSVATIVYKDIFGLSVTQVSYIIYRTRERERERERERKRDSHECRCFQVNNCLEQYFWLSIIQVLYVAYQRKRERERERESDREKDTGRKRTRERHRFDECRCIRCNGRP